MDEAEKYQQRLRAIAEKRRMQEEQERAKRELENEKLRQQQLKRKSLRDQWLMEGPPTSPVSPGPRSPLWGPETQQIEAHIDKLQGEAAWLSEAAERLQIHVGDDSASTKPHREAHKHREGGDMVKPVTAGHLVQGEEEEVECITNCVHKMVVSPSASSLTNGIVGEERSHSAPHQDALVYANGFPDGPITLTFLGFSDVKLGQGVCDEDDTSTIIHAERVIITDDGDEVREVSKQEHLHACVTGERMAPKKGKVGPAQYHEMEAETAGIWNHLGIPADLDHTVRETVIEGRENDTDTSAATSTDLTRVNSTATSTANNTDSGTDATASGVVENPADGGLEGQIVQAMPVFTEEQIHCETVDIQLHDGTADGAEMLPILELFRSQCSAAPSLHSGAQCKPHQEYTRRSVHVSPFSSSQFQEMHLDHRAVQGSIRKTPAVRQYMENEPLLSKATPLRDAVRGNQADGPDGPKMKTCQCCCVM